MDERCASNAADAGSTPVGGMGRCDAKADIAVLKTVFWWFESTHRQSENLQGSIVMTLLECYRRCRSSFFGGWQSPVDCNCP